MALSGWQIALTVGIVFAGAFIHAVTGIGFAIFSMTVMALYLGGVESAALLCYCCLVLVLYMSYKLRRHINFRIAWPPMAAMLVGKVVGVALLMRTDAGVLRTFMGCSFVVIALYFMFQSKLRIKPRVWKGLLIGLVAGVMGGLYNLAGAVIAIYFFSACEDINEYSGSMNLAFIPSEIGGIAMHIHYGNFSASAFTAVGLCCIAIFAGIYLGILVFKKMNRRVIARLLYGYLAVMGVIIALT